MTTYTPPNGQATYPDSTEGVVTATTPSTITVNGIKAVISKIRPVDCPAVGSRVRLELDGRGFIRTLTPLDAATPATPATPAVLSTSQLRLDVLRAAAGFGASRPDMKSTDVLRIAEAWLAWVEHE